MADRKGSKLSKRSLMPMSLSALALALTALTLTACTERPATMKSERAGVEAPMSELDRELASPGEDPTLGQAGVKAETEIEDVTLPGEGPNPMEELVEGAKDEKQSDESRSATTTR